MQLRLRLEQGQWQNLSTHTNRHDVESKSAGHALASADITRALAGSANTTELPITVVRSWMADDDSVTLSFNITNVAGSRLEVGALGIPTPWNNNWEGDDQVQTWSQHVVTDPAPSLDAGYTITNRLTGEGPTLLTVPMNSTPLEAYRLNYPQGSDPRWPAEFLDKDEVSFQSEGIFTWWTAAKALVELDSADAKANGFDRGTSWNKATSVFLKPGQSRTVGIRFAAASGPRAVEDRLTQLGRPTIVGVPGLVIAQGEQAKLVIRSSSRPSVLNVEPALFSFDKAQHISSHLWSITGKAHHDAFGEARVTLGFENGDVASAHYTVIKPHEEQLDGLGAFRFDKQYFEASDDFFHRAPGIISYDHSKMQQVTDDPRAWIAGLSDEGGSGAYVSAAVKQYGRPNKTEVSKLEAFATQTLWGSLQESDPANDRYAGVQKSLFYYDPKGADYDYDPSINRSSTSWNETEASKLSRSYNYPHAVATYWVLYRLARNYDGLVKTRSWSWYLDRAVDTIMAMKKHAGIDAGFAAFGLMEGTYFLEVLQDLRREGHHDQADQVESFMKARADLWKSEQYPYASEFPWDNTGQEEVYEWSRYFNNSATALKTVETLMAVMPSVPHWGYSGAGRDLWDCLYACKAGPGARIERVLHHYKGSQSSLVLMDQFMARPDDIKMLRAGYGGLIGPLASIQKDGFGSSAYHTRYDYLAWDPLSGDSGVNMALYILNARCVFVHDESLGGNAVFGGQLESQGSSLTVTPTDGLRQRLFLAPIALYIELDAGKLHSVTYNSASHEVSVTLASADKHTFNARIRLSTTATTKSSARYAVEGKYDEERGATVVPLGADCTTIRLRRS